MPNKAYVILFQKDEESNGGYFYFPIKRSDREYGGMPQFFGGTKNEGESYREAIERELLEESDGKIKLSGKIEEVHHAKVKDSKYRFYVTEDFLGSHFLGSLKNPEMDRIESYYWSPGESDVEDLAASLKISPSLEFCQSETYQAFYRALGRE